MSAKPPVLVFVGGGPRTVSILERIAAGTDELLPAAGLEIHVIDPFPAGGGRIWRRNQSPLLWMNSVARDVTIFPDSSVICEGPIVPGPALDEWVTGPGRAVLVEAGLGLQADTFSPSDFASREIQSLYLSWAFDTVVDSFPPTVTVTTHRQRAVAVTDLLGADADRQRVELADGSALTADLVVLAQGFLDRSPSGPEIALATAAQRHGLTYIPPGYTADVDLGGLRAGERVLVRGFGLAFIDLMVLVFEGRGGTFRNGADGELTYLAGGREPVLYVGSRRGVPYHSKLGYSIGSAAPVPPVYFTSDAVAASSAATGTADFRTQLWPLVVKELHAAHYRRLFEFHPDRTTGSWKDVRSALDAWDGRPGGLDQLISRSVPEPSDRFDIALIDRPLLGRLFGDRTDLASAMEQYVVADLARRADPFHSADHAVFSALITVYGVLAGAIVAGQVSATDRVRYLEGEFHGLFSFLASGPPPRRLAEMLALHRAGLLHFVGPDMQVEIKDGRFVGWSPAVDGVVVADGLVEARLPRPDVRAASDPIIRGLLRDGQLAAEDLVAPDGTDLGGGQLLDDSRSRAVRADRTVHQARFLLGPSVSGSAGSAGFSRPGFNGPGLRQNDSVARDLLREAAKISGATPTPAPELLPAPELPNPAPARRDRRDGLRHPHTRPREDRIEISHAR